MTSDNERKQKHLQDVDHVLADVRDHLQRRDPGSDVDELRALQLLLEVTKAFHSQHSLTELITLVLDSVLSFARGERAFLILLDEDGEPRQKVGRSHTGAYLMPKDFDYSTSVVEATLTACEPLILLDAQNDQRFNTRESIVKLNLRMVMTAPLRCDDDGPIGLIYVDARRPLVQYTRHHLNVLISLADQAAIALKNVQRFETHTG